MPQIPQLRRATLAIPATSVDLLPQRWRGPTFGSRGFANGQLAFPTHCALSGSVVAVADTVNDRVELFKLDGAFLRALSETPDGHAFVAPLGVALNRKGDLLLVADTDNHRVLLFQVDGAFVRSFGSKGSEHGQLLSPIGVAFGALGEVLVCDADNHRIVAFNNRTGEVVREFGSHGSAPGELRQPYGLAVHLDMLFVADCHNHRIQAFNTEGRFMWSVGTRGSGPTEFDLPQAVSVDRQGRIYVADSRNNRVQVLSLTGMFSHAIMPADDKLDRPRGVSVDFETSLLVIADSGHHRIVVLSAP